MGILAELANGIDDVAVLVAAVYTVMAVDAGLGKDGGNEGEDEEEAKVELHGCGE